jgi:dTDP-4-amino-4,6-dideoxygalactose transaminase
MSRNALMQTLRQRGIGTQVHYIPVPMQPYYRAQGDAMLFCPNARAYYEQALTLPLYFELSDSEQTYVIDVLKELLA